jgi:glycosyltransferase involved in cell wall biosynthesis
MTGPLVSCIIPVYNGADYLADAVRSVLAQRWPAIEIVVVDDGSTDRTPDVARSFGTQVRYIRQGNAGPAVARNNGLAEARGEFIAFLDADDLWSGNKLALQASLLLERPELGVVVGLVQNFWVEAAAEEREQMKDHPRSQPIPGYVTGTMLVRREVFERVGGFDPARIHSDAMEWFLRARAAGVREHLIEEVLLFRRLHGGNQSVQLAASSTDEFLHLLKGSLDRRRAGTRSELVSCVIPVYNGDRFLGAAIESVLTQTRQPVEIIVVDDGSTDGTQQVIAGFGDRIRSLRQENAGPAAARNAGIAMAQGVYLGFLDADDIWLPHKLERQLDELQRHPDAMISFCGMVNFRESETPGAPPEEWEAKPFSPCTMLVRRQLFDTIGTFDVRLRAAEDTEWYCRVMMAGVPYRVLAEDLVRRRQHDRNLTRVDPPSHAKLLGAIKMALDKRRTGSS